MTSPANPILNQPIGGIIVLENTPSLSFTIPTDINNDKLVFEVELDTQNPINPASSDYKKYESRKQQGSWIYWNGTSFLQVPSTGVDSTAYNNECIFTVPATLKNGIWFWKVSVSDNVKCTKFNQGYFEQKRFCALNTVMPITYYINTSSITQNGLTPETGFHNISSLVPLVNDDDVIEIVFSIVDISQPDIVHLTLVEFNKRITIRSFSGNTSKPTINIGSYHHYFNASTDIFDIVFKNTDNHASINLSPNTTAKSNIERCVFYVPLYGRDYNAALQDISIRNNIFIENYMWFSMINYNMKNIATCNNTFYNSSNWSIIFSGGTNTADKTATNVKILNNICYIDAGENYGSIIFVYGDNQIISGTGYAVDCLIDYNCVFSSVGGEELYAYDITLEGPHNLTHTDPLFTNATIEDFTLQANSPALNAGVDNVVQSSVSQVDFIGTTRPQGLHTDIGAYEYI